MWFKNALVYRFNSEIEFNAVQLEQQLKEFSFVPCGETEKQKFGWVEPLGKFGGQLMAHAAEGNILLTAQLQTKVVPSDKVKKSLEEKVAKLEIAEGRPLKRIEKMNLKDEVIIDLLPRAFERDTYTHLLIIPSLGLIVVDASSFNNAEAALALLRKTIGSLPVVPVVMNSCVETIMTQWIKSGEHPQGISILDKAVMQSVLENGGKVTLAKQDMTSEEIQKHIEADKMVTRLALDWQDRLTFQLSDDCSIKSIKWSDELKDVNDDIPREDQLARFDADFVLMCGEFKQFLPAIFDAFDGLAVPTAKTQANLDELSKEEFLLETCRVQVIKTRRPSVSAIQRHCKIGYNRACRIMDMLEALKVVSEPDRNGVREVLVPDQEGEVDNA